MSFILIAESDEQLAASMKGYLLLLGHEVECVKSIAEARTAMDRHMPDMLICNALLSDGGGYPFVREIHQLKPRLAIILTSAQSGESFRILAFEMGADDFIALPFSPKELMLRVDAVLRRSIPSAPQEEELNFTLEGHVLCVDLPSHSVVLDGENVDFTSAQWRVFSLLVVNAGALVPRSEILERCFDYSNDAYERLLDTHIKNIRKKLGEGGWIRTVRGYGYRFAGRRS